ncbi:hypothetical protein [Streptomyces xinghaiensis]|uniref:hypothetical protein n=1 Tax=Streptomyces xinghaiensis TaxID=1038928 RepID=UPI002E0F7769|nr:hypothetical protein OG463_25875 [Streptomyces xinghaiensis]
MATDLSTVTGVRQTLAVVLPVRLTASPAWATGPIPFDLGGRRTDAATRQTYFTMAGSPSLARTATGKKPAAPPTLPAGHGRTSPSGSGENRSETAETVTDQENVHAPSGASAVI